MEDSDAAEFRTSGGGGVTMATDKQWAWMPERRRQVIAHHAPGVSCTPWRGCPMSRTCFVAVIEVQFDIGFSQFRLIWFVYFGMSFIYMLIILFSCCLRFYGYM